jgi:hypothetical protein
VNENHDRNWIIALWQHQSARELKSVTTFKYRVSHIERDTVSFPAVEFDFTFGPTGESHRVSIGAICPSQCASPRAVLLMQNPGRTVEFTPAKRIAYGSRDIDNLSIRKAIRAYLANTGPRSFYFAGNSGTDTSC